MHLSVVIPVNNESQSLRELNFRLHETLKSFSKDFKYQLIYVDDGSTDESNMILNELIDNNTKLITLRANFGKSMALLAGFQEAKGKLIASIDSDLQDYPEDIPSLIQTMKETQCDVVCGWRSKRRDTIPKRLVSKLYNNTIKIVTGLNIHDHNCGLKLYRKEVISQISVYGQLHRYLALQAHLAKFKIIECKVRNASRKFGESKYPTIRYEGIFDLISILLAANARFTPSHFFGLISSVPFIGSSVIMIYLLSFHLFAILTGDNSYLITSRPLFVIAIFLFLASIQILTAGLVCDFYLSKVMQKSTSDTLEYILEKKEKNN